MEDQRFAHVATDPKFRRIPKGEKKVKIDKRFQSMFHDKRFKVNYTTNKRGRPVNQSSSEDLKRYYELDSEDSSSDSEGEENSGQYARAPKSEESEPAIEQDELELEHKSDKQISDKIKNKLKDLNVDYARGDGKLCSESSSDDEYVDEESDSEEVEHKWGELDADADRTDEATSRLAACNMDWDRIRAVDLMVLFNSFLSQNSFIKSVVIYPSDFGLQRMKEEETNGPTELVENKLEETNEEETEEGAKYHMEKLRQYQLNRLKYYYAIVSCDSSSTANKIYCECDGLEYESSATKIDLRFVPEDVIFDTDPKEVCDKLPNMVKYEPRFFTTTALQQAKVDLTWDETNPERIEMTQKLATGKIDDISEADLQDYLASSSEESSEENIQTDVENDDTNPIDKYRALLTEIEDKQKEKEKRDVEMEVSWGIDLKEKTEDLVQKKMIAQENKTPFQEYLDKRNDKRKQKRENKKVLPASDSASDDDVPSDIDLNDPYFAEEFDKPEFKQKKKKQVAKDCIENSEVYEQKRAELELLLSDEDDGKRHFSLKKIHEQDSKSKSMKRRKKLNQTPEVEDDFVMKVNDERFSALFTSHHYNIDPTDPRFKKTKGMEQIVNEKLKRRNADDVKGVTKVVNKTDSKKDAELSVLVKSVMQKTHRLDRRNK